MFTAVHDKNENVKNPFGEMDVWTSGAGEGGCDRKGNPWWSLDSGGEGGGMREADMTLDIKS